MSPFFSQNISDMKLDVEKVNIWTINVGKSQFYSLKYTFKVCIKKLLFLSNFSHKNLNVFNDNKKQKYVSIKLHIPRLLNFMLEEY